MSRWLALQTALRCLSDGDASITSFRSEIASMRCGLREPADYFTRVAIEDIPINDVLLRCEAEIDPRDRAFRAQALVLLRRIERCFIEGSALYSTGSMVGGTHMPVIPAWANGSDIDYARSLLELTEPFDTDVKELSRESMLRILDIYSVLRPDSFLSLFATLLCESILDPSSPDQPADLESMLEFASSRRSAEFHPADISQIRVRRDRLQGRRSLCLRVFASRYMPATAAFEEINGAADEAQ